MTPDLCQWFELLFDLATLAAVAVLATWHGHRFPELRVGVGSQMLLRVAAYGCVHGLHCRRRAPPPQPRPQGAGGAGKGEDGGSGAGCSSSGCRAEAEALLCAAPLAGGEEEGAGGVGVQAALAGPQPLAHARPSAATTSAPLIPAAAAATAAAAEAAAAAAATAAAGAAGAAAPPAPAPASGADPVCPVRPPFTLPHAHAAWAYRSPLVRRTTLIKIPWAEPEQLAPGWAERLQQLAAAQGHTVTGAYVRAGCVELLLEVMGLRGAASTPQQPQQHAALLGSAAAGGACGDWQVDLGALVRALGLGPVEAAALGSVKLVRGRGPHELAPSASVSDDPGPPYRILALEPRVLLVRGRRGASQQQQQQQEQAQAATTLRLLLAGAGAAAARADGGSGPALEVLVRSRGSYLPCVVAQRAPAVPGAVPVEVSYDLELLELPDQPGELLVDVRQCGGLGPVCPVLLLSEPRAAQELLAAAEDWPAAPEELDALLADLAVWARHTADGGAGAGAVPAWAVPLGAHLLSFARGCGLDATAAWVAAGLAAAGLAEPGAVQAGGGGAVGGAAQNGASRAAGASAAAAGGTVAVSDAAAAAGSGGGPVGMGGRGALGRPRLLRRVLGLEAVSAAEEAAFAEYAAPLILAQGHVIQAVECLCLAALLYRSRHNLLCRGNLTSLAGCAVGAFTAAARLVLPPRRWAALVEGCKLPRYGAYMAAKLMIASGRFPAPPGIVGYQRGPGMLTMEGLLLPWSCLLDLRTALVVTLLKLPLGVGMTLGSGAAEGLLPALWLNGRAAVAALATTLACHAYLRASYERAARVARAAKGAKAE